MCGIVIVVVGHRRRHLEMTRVKQRPSFLDDDGECYGADAWHKPSMVRST